MSKANVQLIGRLTLGVGHWTFPIMNDELRALFPVTERAIYLNHAAVSAPPLPTINAIQSQLPKNSPTSNVQRPTSS